MGPEAPFPELCVHCRIEDLEKDRVQLNGERQRLQEDLEEVQERLTAGLLWTVQLCNDRLTCIARAGCCSCYCCQCTRATDS